MMDNTALFELLALDSSAILKTSSPLSRAEAEAIAKTLRAHSFHVCVIELVADSSDIEEGLLSQLDEGFSFPDYFGGNWNAVDECIRDLSWLPAEGYCAILLNRSVLDSRSHHLVELFESVMTDASEHWKGQGKRFCLLWSS